jgi:sugar (pentulose or hexulose) kinase
MVRQYIAAATDRPEHTIEQADAEVGGAAATLLEQGWTESIAIYTNDLPAFRGIERALSQHGYEDLVQLVKAFDFVRSVENRYRFSG